MILFSLSIFLLFSSLSPPLSPPPPPPQAFCRGLLSKAVVVRLVPRRSCSGGRAFNRYLLATNVGVAAASFGLGDITSQLIDQHPVALERSARVAGAGAIIGVGMHYWYQFLDRHVIGTTFAIVRKKVLLDMCIFGPPFCASFILLMGLSAGDVGEQLWKDVKEIWPKLYLLDWCVYPGAQYVNFRFIPHKFRVLYLCFIGYVVDSAVCWIYHQRKLKKT